jgi:hypothetical protein
VRELEGENDNLRMKIRALEIIQAKPRKEEDERQQHLEVQHTESVKVEEDEASTEKEKTPTIPSSTTKRKGKKRVNIGDKLKDLPVLKTTVLIPDEVHERPEQWEEIGAPVVKREVIALPTTLGIHEIIRKKFRFKIDRSVAPIIAKAPIRFSSSYVSISNR